MITLIIWLFGGIIAALMLKIIYKISESKDPMFKMFADRGFRFDDMYGLTEADKKKLKRLKKEAFLIFTLGFVVFILIIAKNNL